MNGLILFSSSKFHWSPEHKEFYSKIKKKIPSKFKRIAFLNVILSTIMGLYIYMRLSSFNHKAHFLLSEKKVYYKRIMGDQDKAKAILGETYKLL